MRLQNWTIHHWIGVAIAALVLIVGISLVVATLRDSEKRKPAGQKSTTGASSSREAYTKLSESRQVLITDLIHALETATESNDRKKIQELSIELSRQGDAGIGMILQTLKENRAWNLRITLLDVLQAIRSQKAVLAFSDFYASLKKTEVALKLEILKRLSPMGGRITREALVKLLEGESDEEPRLEISKALVALGITPDEVSKLGARDRELLGKDVSSKHEMRERLSSLRNADPESEKDFADLKKTALEDRTIAIAIAAFRKLEERGDGDAATVLAQRVKAPAETNQDRIIQTNALAALTRMPAVDARLAVKDIALNGSPELRLQVVHLLASYGDEAMIPLLEEIAKKDDSEPLGLAIERARVSIRARAAAKAGAKK